MIDYDQIALEAAIQYCIPIVPFFIAQTAACLFCKTKWLRLTPTLIVALIAVYHLSVIIAEIHGVLMVLSIPYLLAEVGPSLLGVGLGWAVYVVKLVIQEYRQLENS